MEESHRTLLVPFNRSDATKRAWNQNSNLNCKNENLKLMSVDIIEESERYRPEPSDNSAPVTPSRNINGQLEQTEFREQKVSLNTIHAVANFS